MSCNTIDCINRFGTFQPIVGHQRRHLLRAAHFCEHRAKPWVLAAALTLIMPAVLESVPPVAIFLSFAAMMAVQLIWVRAVMPETKGRALEDIAPT